MTADFKLEPEKLYSVKTLSNYEIFTDNLYSILQNIDQLVGINDKDNTYTLYYTSYERLEEDEDFHCSESENHSGLKKLCNMILSALKGEVPMPIISIDSTNEDFLSCESNNLIFLFNAIKEKDKRDMLYENIYSYYPPNQWLNSLRYIDEKLESTKEEIIDYLFNKTYEKETSKSQLSFLRSLLSVPEMKLVEKYREDILQILENCYGQFLDFDKQQDTTPNAFIYSGDNPRSFVDHFLSSQETSDNWYLYQKFTSSGKFINEAINEQNLFELPDFILEPLNINHKVLMSQYSTLIDKTTVTTMLNDIVKFISYGGGIKGISKVDRIYCQDEYQTTIFAKINNASNKDKFMDDFKKILTNMFEFYQSTIVPMGKITEHEKEKLLQQAISTFILDAKIPNKESIVTPLVKKRKI